MVETAQCKPVIQEIQPIEVNSGTATATMHEIEGVMEKIDSNHTLDLNITVVDENQLN